MCSLKTTNSHYSSQNASSFTLSYFHFGRTVTTMSCMESYVLMTLLNSNFDIFFQQQKQQNQQRSECIYYYVQSYIYCSCDLQVEDHVTECCTVDYIDNILYMNECTPFFLQQRTRKNLSPTVWKKKVDGKYNGQIYFFVKSQCS